MQRGQGHDDEIARALMRFRLAMDTGADAIFIIDRETHQYVDCTQSACEYTGCSREQLLQMGPADLTRYSREIFDRHFEEVIAAGSSGVRSEVADILKDGRQVVTENYARAISVEGRCFIVIRSRDVTEQRKAQRGILRLGRMFAALGASNEAVLHGGSPDELFQRVCDAAVEGGKFLAAAVFEASASGAHPRLAGLSGFTRETFTSTVEATHAPRQEGRGLVVGALETRQACISNDFRRDPRTVAWRDLATHMGICSAAAIPLIRGNNATAVLMLYSHELDAFDSEIVDLLWRMARNVVFALENFDRELLRNRTELQLRETQARLDRTTCGANDGLWELNLDSMETWASAQHAEMLGYSAEDFLREGADIFRKTFHEQDLPLRMAMKRCIEDDTPVDVELKGRRRDGEWRWFRIRGRLYRDESGRALTLSGSQQDITEQRNQHEQLIEALQVAADANRAKGEFLANMSHEIRTPMNGVIGMSELLLETPLDPVQLDYATTVRDSARGLLTVINDILDFSKIEAGKLEIESIDMDVRDAVADVARLLAIQAHAKGLEVIAVLDPALPDMARGDAGRLRQVLLNLGGNAVKFTQAGEVALECRLLESRPDGCVVRFEVRDTGIGIPADRMDVLFHAFSQVDASTTRKFGGTGLGLSIVKRLVSLMQGEVGVSSVEGQGSTFWFTVRLDAASDAQQAGRLTPVALRGQRVLVVDDNATNRRVLMGQLSLCHMDPVCVASAEEALSVLRQAALGGRPFDVALLDHQMPGVDGEQLGKIVLADDILKATRLVLLTSSGKRGDGRLFCELGFAGYLLKPVMQRDLVDCLAMVLGAQAEVWHTKTSPMVTHHALRSMRQHGAQRVLLAEDNVVNQKVACRLLEKLGCQVDVASNGEAAVSAWETGRYALILMDCQMPNVDGYEATRRIRSREACGQRIPIIALTAHAMKGADQECIEAGMDDYLSKPVDGDKLRECLQRWLGNSEEPDALQPCSATHSI